MTTTHTPVRAVAGSVAGIDIALLLFAGWLTVDTYQKVHAPNDDGLASLGYFFASLFVAVALPSLVLAVVALRTRGATAIACAILSVLALAVSAVFVASY
jgi:hypothetical protein